MALVVLFEEYLHPEPLVFENSSGGTGVGEALSVLYRLCSLTRSLVLKGEYLASSC